MVESIVRAVGGSVRAVQARLADRGVELVLGTAVDLAGVARAKGVPRDRFEVFASAGVGASPSWLVFCVDPGIAFTADFGVVGDLRLRIDPALAVVVAPGVVWAPGDLLEQDGSPAPACPRQRLRRVMATLAEAGLSARTGAELEFVLTAPDGGPRMGAPWQGYGLRSALDVAPLLTELVEAFRNAGMPIEQLHAEYGANQFEISLPPADPLTTADRTVLGRLLIGRAAANHGFGASFSPLPFPDGAGNGAHLHLSLSGPQGPLFAGGTLTHGLTADGGAAIAGLIDRLSELLTVFAGCALSPRRRQPGRWAGAFACWGLENREAAVRLIADTAGNPHGASVELKVVDASANPYLAAAALLGAALDGIQRSLPLPAEVTVNPTDLPGAAAFALTGDQGTALAALDGSAFARRLLGDQVVDGTLAVRRYEQRTFGDADPDDLTAAFRLAFSC